MSGLPADSEVNGWALEHRKFRAERRKRLEIRLDFGAQEFHNYGEVAEWPKARS